MKKWVWHIVRVVVTVAVLAWILSTVHWHDRVMVKTGDGKGRAVEYAGPTPAGGARVIEGGAERTLARDQLMPGSDGQPIVKVGLRNVGRNVNWWLLVLSVPVFALVPFFAAIRWRGLLAVQKVPLTVGTAVKLTWVGLFFNQFMIGTVGGDVVKAYYVTRHTDSAKAESVLTILIDRIIGMLGLLWISGAGILLSLAARPGGGELPSNLPWAWVTGIIAVVALGATLFYNRWLRARLGLDALLGRLGEGHIIRRLDRAAHLYWHRKRLVAAAFGWTFCSHVCLLTATALAAWSLGLRASVLHVATAAPIVYVGAGLIPSLAGQGPLEGGFVLFFAAPAIGSNAQALMLALVYRLQLLITSLPGAVLQAIGAHLPSRSQMRRELETLSEEAAA